MANARTPPSPAGNVFDDAELVALLARETGVAEGDVRAMVEGVRRGEDQAEYFGLTPAIQASLENCGVAYYRGKRYAEARQIFEALIFLTEGKRPSVWRGAAACHQVEHAYEEAVYCYAQALVQDDADTLSAAHCGECLCLLGRREEGVALLEALVASAPAREAKSPHILRAKALLAAGGGPGTPSPMAKSGKKHRGDPRGTEADKNTPAQADASTEASHALTEEDVLQKFAGLSLGERLLAEDGELESFLASLAQDDDEQDAQGDALARAPSQAADADVRAMLADPEARERLEQIALAVRNNELSIRTLADFSDEQMDAGYAVACQYLEQDEVLMAWQVCGQMLYLDGHDTRFLQLSGLCAHRMQLYCLADYFYGLVAIWRPGGADPATLIYRGEAKILADETEAGLAMVRSGIDQGKSDPQMAELIRRGEALLKQGAQMAQIAQAARTSGAQAAGSQA